MQPTEGIQQVIPHANAVLCPHGIERGVVGDPVDDDLHVIVMRRGHEGIEILPCAVVGVQGRVILNTVWAAKGRAPWLNEKIVLILSSLAVDLTNRVNRHEPDDVHTELVKPSKIGSSAVERAGRRMLAHVHFIDDSVLGPLGMDQHIGGVCWGGVTCVARGQHQAS